MMRMKPTFNIDIRIGFREICAIMVAIPVVYEKIRKVKLKYDKKEQVIKDSSGTLRPGEILYSTDGGQWTVVK